MITIRSPYGGGSLEVADDSVEVFLAAGYVVEKVAAPPVETKPELLPPPQGGPGSGVKVWQKYALDLGLAWAEDSEVTRDEFIERIAEAGFPVE